MSYWDSNRSDFGNVKPSVMKEKACADLKKPLITL